VVVFAGGESAQRVVAPSDIAFPVFLIEHLDWPQQAYFLLGNRT
jgi:hypothetical protein